MSEKMTPLSFKQLMTVIIKEYEKTKSVFGVHRPYVKKDEKFLPIFKEKIETPFGPAAGPNTQLAQNIVAAYFAGSRFFELKTVQIMDGEQLASCIARPCINASDECYNCEWSTELTVPQAFEEYVKAWCALKIISRAFGLGDSDGFVFNMSVGYDLDGIKSEKIDRFIEGLKNAKNTDIFKECKTVLSEMFPQMTEYISTISPHVCTSVTLSTLHGCPPDEIERIASYLLTEKHLNTYVKCNPTILGYDCAREILNGMGYDYVSFDDHHFNEDLQYADAVKMFKKLVLLAKENGLEFGLKLSNTFPVDIKAGELPGEEMYMSGKALLPLTIEMARKFSEEFDGKLRISYSGGADYFNIDKLFEAGIWPITLATTVLKPGGYQRMTQIAQKLEKLEFKPFEKVDTEKVAALSEAVRKNALYTKAIKPLPKRKSEEKVSLIDCFTAPCKNGCPIHQDIPEYISLCGEKKFSQALEVITLKNPLPFITGTICSHRCMEKCTRNFYETPVKIRDTKLLAAENGYDEYIKALKPNAKRNEKIAVIGGGTSAIAAAFFAARSGMEVTIFEREKKLGGIVRNVIPSFRISDEAIDKDISLIEKLGVKIKTNTPAPSVNELFSQGFTHVIFAVGAYKPGNLDLGENTINVIEFLRKIKSGEFEDKYKNIVIIGGGNTAMDAARAAVRLKNCENVTIAYRRTKKYMPADEEELLSALEDGVKFTELVSPQKAENGKLYLKKTTLTKPDQSGRRKAVETDEVISIDADLTVLAIGEKVDTDIFTQNGITVCENGRPNFVTNIQNVYNIGDSLRGPATVVEGISDALNCIEHITKESAKAQVKTDETKESAIGKKGILCTSCGDESKRCLSCNVICQTCADVCPNRANAVITFEDGRNQILHLDRLCNECGNCKTFCPYSSAPYLDKFTLFNSLEDFNNSENKGFLPLGKNTVKVRLESVFDCDLNGQNELPKDIEIFILTVLNDYGYLIGDDFK